MSDIIEHTGFIISLNNNTAKVRIEKSPACSSCRGKSYCMSSENGDTEIDALTDEPNSFHVGEEVTIYLKRKLGFKALLLAFIIPILLIVTILSIGNFYWEEKISGLLSLTITVIYFFILYFFRNKLNQQFVFFVKHS